jgi:small-conductance mechanosensitive channel
MERTKMNELKTLESRLKLATDRISVALSAKSDQQVQLTAAQDTNLELQKQIQEVRSERAGDLAEVNKLIEQIRPLMEGNENA